METGSKATIPVPVTDVPDNYFRFHLPHLHLGPVFGDDWFSLKAEAFARFFETPVFLVSQTVIVAIWIGLNAAGIYQIRRLSVYPAKSRFQSPGSLCRPSYPACPDTAGRPRQGARRC